MNKSIFSSIVAIALLVGCTNASTNRLVNMIPQTRSGETNQDAEPTITVDYNYNNRMAGSAFTWDNLTGSPMISSTAPIYVSNDSGNTWTLAYVVPSELGAESPTGDITLSFSSVNSPPALQTGWLYAGTLSSVGVGRPMTVLRVQDPLSGTTMVTLDTRTGKVDQPHTSVLRSGAGQDKLYVGFNNGFNCTAPSGRSATLDVSQDGATAAPALALDLIEARNTPCQDGYATVPAVHRDGTVYAAFIHDSAGSPRLVVVRDDNWGTGVSPFSDLKDPSDNVAGRYVTNVLNLPSGRMGQNRLGVSNVSIAVNPNDSNLVYVAWGDSGGANRETIHVIRSVDRGINWSSDLVTVTDALNPEVAINDWGTVGVLYQQLVSGRWQTHFVRTTDGDATIFDTPGTLLANQSASTPASTYDPYIGDYASLVGVGKNFVGMFSASNYPDKANFMDGVKFHREVDWTTHKLYSDSTHTTEVPPSIDPFFFEIELSICSQFHPFCNICQLDPAACYPIYDPWWRFKCPACTVEIFINPGDEISKVTMFDSNGHEIGQFKQLKENVVISRITYTQRLTFQPQKGVSLLLKAELSNGKKLNRDFHPDFTMRTLAKGDKLGQ
ncbi:hypothetical protein [Burkholderia ubonensis]|uniref:hypothetical protein n=1 Tax=Burkholderia ubonensis TaxID=101571 RepID=UPI000AFA1105|nr:hypothetical protein [Burkholderia ubonensis]